MCLVVYIYFTLYIGYMSCEIWFEIESFVKGKMCLLYSEILHWHDTRITDISVIMHLTL